MKALRFTEGDLRECGIFNWCLFSSPKLYINYNGLREVEVKYVEFVFRKFGETLEFCDYTQEPTRVLCNIAGVGDHVFNLNKVEADLYASVADFREDIPAMNNYACYDDDIVHLFPIFCEFLNHDHLNGSISLYRFQWDGSRAVKADIDEHEELWFRYYKGGETKTNLTVPENSYLTREECEEASDIAVYEFDKEYKIKYRPVTVEINDGGTVRKFTDEKAEQILQIANE